MNTTLLTCILIQENGGTLTVICSLNVLWL